MSRVLFATIGSLGDLHPVIALGLELRERGHAVSFCVSAPYQAMIESLGFRFHRLSPDVTPASASAEQIIHEIMDPMRGVERLLRKYLLPHVRASYDDLARAVAADGGADLLVSGELVYVAPLVAEKTQVRWASYTASPMSFFSAYDPPLLAPLPKVGAALRLLGPAVNRTAIGLAKWLTRTWSEPVRQLRAELGLNPGRDPIYEGKFSPRLALALFSSVVAEPQPDWPPHTIVTGFPFYDGPDDSAARASELDKFFSLGEPPIVFTLGSAAVLDPGNFYTASAEAARLLKRRAILLLGSNPPPPHLPATVLAAGYARYSQVFPRASVVVHQGGIGTTGQALRAGCPMLIMPYNFDQPDNAARMERLGVARTISRKRYTVPQATRELTSLLTDPKYANAAREASRRVQREQGAKSACDALERLLAE